MIESPIKVPCTLVPVRGYNLCIPNAAIEEITVHDNLMHRTSHPSWIAGTIDFHEQTVNVIFFESLAFTQESIARTKPVIVVLKNYLPGKNQSFFGIRAIQIPSLVQANSHSIRKDLNPEKLHPFAASYARINGKSVVIPNLEDISAKLQEVA